MIDTRIQKLISAKRVTKQDARKMERKAKKNKRLGKKIWVKITQQPERTRSGKYVGRATFYRQKDPDEKKRSVMINVGDGKAKLSIRGKKLYVQPKAEGAEGYYWGDQPKKEKTADEKPDDYHERVGRCPPGYWWEDGACTIREEAKKMRAERRRKKTGDAQVDEKLEEALKESFPVKDAAGEISIDEPVEYRDFKKKEFKADAMAAKDNLTDEERSIAEDYTLQTVGGLRSYQVLNAYLRGGHKAAKAAAKKLEVRYSTKAVERNAKEFSDIINKSELSKDTNVYRGANSKDLVNQYMNMNPGDEIQSEGFWSTSADKKTARGFSDLGDDVDSVQFVIQMPKGSKALNVSEISGFPPEQEVVINNGSKFKFVKRRQLNKGKGGIVVTLQYIGDGDVK